MAGVYLEGSMLDRTTEFDAFWESFPRRVGKIDAKKAYAKARTQASAAEILAGVASYIQHKPEYADWCHPATWLNKGRWMDEYDVPVKVPAVRDWFDECKELHNGACEERLRHVHRVKMDAYKAEAS
jgi:hypothetical protein